MERKKDLDRKQKKQLEDLKLQTASYENEVKKWEKNRNPEDFVKLKKCLMMLVLKFMDLNLTIF